MMTFSETEAISLLQHYGISPTSQRVEMTRLLMRSPIHLSAEDVFRSVNTGGHRTSKATVYNTLNLMTKKGMIREVIADPTKIFYDSNTQPHHHFFDVTTGALKDIDASKVQVNGLPPLPEGTVLEGVEVVVRFRSAKVK